MKIIIAGAGKIGHSIADILASEGHDITVIDHSSEIINLISNSLDVICVEGSAASPETLAEAGAAQADLLMAATEKDEINMVCGIIARKLGTKHVIARIRDPQYLNQSEFFRDALGLSVIVNPEFECAKEISRILRFPGAVRVDAFSKGSVEIVEHRIPENGRLKGTILKDLVNTFGAKVLVSVVEREGEAFIPNGGFVMQAGDKLSITGTSAELRKFFSATGQYKKPVKKVMIMGGGKICVYLTKMLEANGISVTVVDRDRDRCDELCDLLPSTRIIHGDATRSDVLLEEGLESCDAFVALTGDDGDNVITSMFAKNCNVGKIVTKVNREHFSDILESSGLESIVAPKQLVAQQLARYVRGMSNSLGSSMETLYRLSDGKVEALEFKVSEKSNCVGTPLKKLHLKPNILICAVIRGSKSIIPDGDTVIQPGDHAIIVCAAGRLKDLDDIVED